VELVVNDLEQTMDRLEQNGVQFISRSLASLNNVSDNAQGYLVRDPSGHAMLVMALRSAG
jgi:extradiol dioxygenase family protein